MAHTRDIIDFVEFFQEILPKSLIMEKSKELDCLQRQRKLDFHAFVWATLFSLATGHSRTLAAAILHKAIDPKIGRLSLTNQVNAGLGYP